MLNRKLGPYAYRGLLGIAVIVTLGVLMANPKADTASHTGTFRRAAVLGGIKHRDTSQNFRGGKATAIMGGVELDLREAVMEGEEAVLKVSTIMGGVSLRVPDTWVVDARVTPIMGGLEDKTHHTEADGQKRLIVEGTVIMGGVEIRN